MIKCTHVDKCFRDVFVFQDMSIEIKNVGMYILLGKSGIGKSTFLNMVMGFEKADAGELLVTSNAVMIFQQYELMDELTVEENILLGREKTKRIADLINKMKMDSFLDCRISELSGGQKQRVGILRCLYEPVPIILCDEPTESLDIQNKVIVMDVLKELSKEAIVLMVTHDLSLAQEYGDYFYEIQNHKICCVKKPEKTLALADTSADDKNGVFSLTKTVLNKVFFRRSNVFLVSQMLFSFLLLVLFFLNSFLFQVLDSTNVLNANYLYIERLSDELDEQFFADADAIVKFKGLYFENRKYPVSIYPFVNHEHYEKPVKGVYINRNAVSELKNVEVGDELTLNYVLQGVEYSYLTFVEGIVEDEDIAASLVYYNLELFEEYLASVPMSTNDGSANQLEFQINNPTFYQRYIPYENQKVYYEWFKKEPLCLVEAPLYEERLILQEESRVYQFIYYIILFFISTFFLTYTFLFFFKEQKRVNRNVLLLTSQGMEFDSLKRIYFRNRFVLFTLNFILCAAIAFLLYLYKKDILLVVALFVFVLQYFISSLILFHGYKKRKNDILVKDLKKERI